MLESMQLVTRQPYRATSAQYIKFWCVVAVRGTKGERVVVRALLACNKMDERSHTNTIDHYARTKLCTVVGAEALFILSRAQRLPAINGSEYFARSALSIV